MLQTVNLIQLGSVMLSMIQHFKWSHFVYKLIIFLIMERTSGKNNSGQGQGFCYWNYITGICYDSLTCHQRLIFLNDIMSNFTFGHNVFESCLLLFCQNASSGRKGIIVWITSNKIYLAHSLSNYIFLLKNLN